MTLPDNRIKFPSSLIDFDEDVHGGSPDGQDVNSFPSPGQARFDHMRLAIIGLLANQSSFDEPVNFKIGTLWFSLNDQFFKYYDGENFEDIAKAIRVGEQTLEEWSEEVQGTIGKITEQASFSGTSLSNGITEINIPEGIHSVAAFENNHPLLFIEGLLVDPRSTSFNIDRNVIILSDGIELNANDQYTVIIQRVDNVVPETVIMS